MDYEVPIFHYSLPKYLMQALERIQLVIAVMRPSILLSTFKELATHHDEICETLFDTIIVIDTVLRIILLSFHERKNVKKYP